MSTDLNTPWGRAETVEEIAPGITYVSTPSHGGFLLSPERNAEIPADVKASTWRALGEGGWYEEDCDAAIVVAQWPEYFADRLVRAAEATLRWRESRRAQA